jgi:hypothetical protein
MSVEHAKEFLKAFEKDENLRKEFSSVLNLKDAVVKVQKQYMPELDFTIEELEQALEETLGDIYQRGKACILGCFSEVPGY